MPGTPIAYQLTGAAEEYLEELRHEQRGALEELLRLAAAIGPMMKADERKLLHRTCGGAMSSRYRPDQLELAARLEALQVIELCSEDDRPGASYRRTKLGVLVARHNDEHVLEARAVGQK